MLIYRLKDGNTINPRYQYVYMNAQRDLTRYRYENLKSSHQTKTNQHELSSNMASTINAIKKCNK